MIISNDIGGENPQYTFPTASNMPTTANRFTWRKHEIL